MRYLIALFFISAVGNAPLAAGPAPDKLPARYVRVDLTYQRVELHENGSVVWQTEASSGREGFETPTGWYKISDKHEKWVSSIYDVPMPYFLRLDWTTTGLHAGIIPGFPASHGCVRMPKEKAIELFNKVDVGTPVVIEGTAPSYADMVKAINLAHRSNLTGRSNMARNTFGNGSGGLPDNVISIANAPRHLEIPQN